MFLSLLTNTMVLLKRIWFSKAFRSAVVIILAKTAAISTIIRHMNAMPSVLEAIFEDVRSKHYPKGQIMLYQHDPSLDVLLLKEGIVKVYDIDEQGNEKTLHLLKPWAIMPFVFFSGNEDPTQWFYSALTDCDVCVVPIATINAQIRANNELMLYLMHWFSQEVHEVMVRLSSLGKTNTRDKLVAALKYLALYHCIQRRSGWRRVTFPVNHQLLADMTGMTRESAATIMKSLQDEHIVRNPRLTILEINFEKLVQSSIPTNP